MRAFNIDIPEIPEGWEPFEYRTKNIGDFYLNEIGEVVEWTKNSGANCNPNMSRSLINRPSLILRRTEPTGEALIGKLCWVWNDGDLKRLFAVIADYGHQGQAWYVDVSSDCWDHASLVKLSEIKDKIDMEN